jgi:hypothetical protein
MFLDRMRDKAVKITGDSLYFEDRNEPHLLLQTILDMSEEERSCRMEMIKRFQEESLKKWVLSNIEMLMEFAGLCENIPGYGLDTLPLEGKTSFLLAQTMWRLLQRDYSLMVFNPEASDSWRTCVKGFQEDLDKARGKFEKVTLSKEVAEKFNGLLTFINKHREATRERVKKVLTQLTILSDLIKKSGYDNILLAMEITLLECKTEESRDTREQALVMSFQDEFNLAPREYEFVKSMRDKFVDFFSRWEYVISQGVDLTNMMPATSMPANFLDIWEQGVLLLKVRGGSPK